MESKVLRHASCLALLVTALAACSPGLADDTDPSRLKVVTTVAPITSIAASIGGDRVSITGLVPEGTNSHTFEPPPSASADLAKADVVLVNGLQLEEPTKDLAAQTMNDAALLVELGTTVLPKADYVYDFSFPEDEGKPNPHLWTDPTWAIKYAEVISETFSAADPDNAPYYQQNLEAFRSQATGLADALRADQESIPGPRALLTYHDAYAYFADTFGWSVIGAIQPKNFEDPSPQEVARLIDQIRAQEVPTIFGSEVFPSKALAQIAEETGVRYEDTLRDDDLPGGPSDADHSWLGLMRYDYVTMITGLGGSAPTLESLDVREVAPDDARYPQ
ncbi:metal ABC transporter substrate-binding protein [Nocardioides sp.]|uniref:metal ABC transporter substrate-binding protein n=1 Tax=Nocardioides sp. TaxID=35761 RepID=UPI00321AB14F